MKLPPIDELMAMDEDQLQVLKETELAELYKVAGPKRSERLKAVQWRVDMAVRMAPNKLAGCIVVSKMAYESFYNLRVKLNELNEDLKELL